MTDILADIGYLVLFVNFVVFSMRFSGNTRAFKIFTIYCGLMFIIQMLANTLNYLAIHNLFLSHFYFISQYLILSYFYYQILTEKRQRSFIKIGAVLVVLSLGIQYILDPSGFFRFNLFEIFITSFLLIICATFHFYNMLNESKEYYYINMGILIYLFGSTTLFLAGNLVANLTSRLNTLTWTCNAALYIVYQVFIFIEWKRNYMTKKE